VRAAQNVSCPGSGTKRAPTQLCEFGSALGSCASSARAQWRRCANSAKCSGCCRTGAREAPRRRKTRSEPHIAKVHRDGERARAQRNGTAVLGHRRVAHSAHVHQRLEHIRTPILRTSLLLLVVVGGGRSHGRSAERRATPHRHPASAARHAERKRSCNLSSLDYGLLRFFAALQPSQERSH
jgi:hypothetical protein